MRNAIKDYTEIKEKLTDSDVEMLEMEVDVPFNLPPKITRKTSTVGMEKGNLKDAVKSLAESAGVNLLGITRCTFTNK